MPDKKKDDIKIKAKDYILYQQKHKNRVEIDLNNENVFKAQDLKLKKFKNELKDSINIQSPILNDNKAYNELLDKLGDHVFFNNITSQDAINLVQKELKNKQFRISNIENKVDEIIYQNAVSNPNNQYLDEIINKTQNNSITENELKDLIDKSNKNLNYQYGFKENNKDKFSVKDMQEDLQVKQEQRKDDFEFEKLNAESLRTMDVDKFESDIKDDDLNSFLKENINDVSFQNIKNSAILNQRKLIANQDIKDQFKYEYAKNIVDENFKEIDELKADYDNLKPLSDIREIEFDKYVDFKSNNILNKYENYLINKSNDNSSFFNIIDNVDNAMADFNDNRIEDFSTASLSKSVNENTATNGTINLDTFHTDDEYTVGNAGTNTLKFENLRKDYTKVFAYNPSDVSKYQLLNVKGEKGEFEYKAFTKDEYTNAIQTNLSDDKIKFLIDAKEHRLISEQQFKNILYASKNNDNVGRDVLTTMVQNYEKSPVSFNQQIPDIVDIGKDLKNIKNYSDFERVINSYEGKKEDFTSNQRVKYILNTVKSSDKTELDRFLRTNDTKIPYVSTSVKKEFLENFNKNSPDITITKEQSDSLFKGYSTKLDENSKRFLKDCYTNGIITNTQLRYIAQTTRKPLEVREKVVDSIISYRGLFDLPKDTFDNPTDEEESALNRYGNVVIDKKLEISNKNRIYLLEKSDALKTTLSQQENENIDYDKFKSLIYNDKEFRNIRRSFENLENKNQDAIKDVTKDILANMRVSYANREKIENAVETLNDLKHQYRKELTFEVYKRNLDRKRIEYILNSKKNHEDLEIRVDHYLKNRQKQYKVQSDEGKIKYIKYEDLLSDCLDKTSPNPFHDDINSLLKNEDLDLINSIADKLKVKPYSQDEINIEYSKFYYNTRFRKEYSRLLSKTTSEKYRNLMISKYNDYASIGINKMRPFIKSSLKATRLELEKEHENVINVAEMISKHSAKIAKEHFKYQAIDNQIQKVSQSVINKTVKEDTKNRYFKVYDTIKSQPDALRNMKNKVIVDLTARYHNSYAFTTLLMAKKLGIATNLKAKELKTFIKIAKNTRDFSHEMN